MTKIENFIALRYIRENRKNKEISGSSKIVIVTIAAAVIFYICAVSVMNGYIQGRMQLQFELTSFHLNYYDIDRESVAMDICEQLDKNFDVAVNYYFRETKVLLSANRINTGLAYFRSVPANVFLIDKGLNKYVRLLDGEKDLSAGNILISGKTAAKMKLKVGDTLHICAVMAGSDAQVRYKKCTVAGIFSTGFTELDEQLAFIGDDTNANLFDERVKYTVAVKLFDYRKAAEFAYRNKFSGYAAVSTWEEENYNELSALKFEKSVIALIVILVIIVAVLNILTTIHITVMEKQTDIGVLKAIGYSPRQVVAVFLLVGYYLGMIGVFLGTVFGLSIMHSLNDIMVGLGSIANGYMDIINAICGLFASLPPIDRIEIYASDFYLDKIYTDIGFGEVLFVAFLTVHFALAASIIPAMRTRNIKPNEVIKNGYITTHNLRKIYKTDSEELLILDGIDFTLGAGETVAITGESGSGKSTFLNMLGGLDNATSGSIIIDGNDITKLDESELTYFRNRKIGFIFQSHYLLDEFSACENVMIPMLMNNFDRKAASDKAMELLKLVGMDHRSHHYPSQLSGGERQRVAIARAFMNDPQIILADEPTGNLDEKNSAKVLDLLLDITLAKNFALIMVTHSIQSAKLTAKEYHLANGKLECIR